MQGVRVSLKPGNYSTLTSATGQYTLVGVGAGQYALTAAYAGFGDATWQVTITPGGSGESDITLAVASSVQSVQVYGGREGGEVEAINRTFNADNIINVYG